MKRFFSKTQLGPKQSKTPEGFLICQDVPIARTGEYHYLSGEVPVPAGPDGIVRIVRDESTVFAEDAIASFVGKPVTDEHPPIDVTTTNWNTFTKGVVQHVRRGTGDAADFLVADLLIYDPKMIDDIRAGKREVSCGYDASYTTDAPGVGRQTAIVGNHVALVKRGRAGVRCAIGDSDPMTKTIGDLLKEAADKGPDAMSDVLKQTVEGSRGSVPNAGAPVIMNFGTSDAARTPVPEAPKTQEPTLAEQIATAVNAALDARGLTVPTKTADTVTIEPPKAKTFDAEPEEVANDSGAGLVAAYGDVVSRSAILAPSLAAPPLSGQQTVDKVRETIHDLRVRSLDAAYALPAGKAAIDLLTGSAAKPDFTKMTHDGLRTIHRAAANAVGAKNNAGAVTIGNVVIPGSAPKVPEPAELNKVHNDFWATNARAH